MLSCLADVGRTNLSDVAQVTMRSLGSMQEAGSDTHALHGRDGFPADKATLPHSAHNHFPAERL